MKESAFDEITKSLPRIDVKIIEKDNLQPNGKITNKQYV